jgi:radical SAM superfamily enzyme YgiQ (UPF0313 family)
LKLSRKKIKEVEISKNQLRVNFRNKEIHIFWQGNKITEKTGLNSAINTFGLWSNSSFANWEAIGSGENWMKLKARWSYLPVTQYWFLKLGDNYQIDLEIDMEVEEELCVKEAKSLLLVSPLYKNWFSGFKEEDFPQLNDWQELYTFRGHSVLTGVRFPLDGAVLPPVALEFQPKKDLENYTFVQNSPAEINARFLGEKILFKDKERYFSPGYHSWFRTKIKIFETEQEVSRYIERQRKKYFRKKKQNVLKNKPLSYKPAEKVLLANMPWQDKGREGVRSGSRWPHMKDKSEGKYLPFPFFLAYSVSLLRANGIKTDLIDAIAEKIQPDDFIEILSGKNIDYLVVETSVPSFDYDIKLLEKISLLGINIILCGPHPFIASSDFLAENDFIDFVIFGEYEVTLLELLKFFSKNDKDFSSIKGLVWRRRSGEVVKNEARPPFDINILPWPHRESLPMENYWDLPGDIPYPSVQMVASRGCPFGCNFCLWPQVLFGGSSYRTRNIKDCIDEMEFMVRKKGYKSVYFDDDTFNIGKRRMIEFCNEIIKRGLEDTPWAIMAKADLMDEEILDNMKKAGLCAVKYGVENAEQSLVDRCGKGLDLAKAKRMINYTKSLGIKVHLTFSFGLRGETKETIEKTIDYALKSDPDSIQFSIITPFPGTRLFEELEKEGKILTRDWSLYDGHNSCVFAPDNLSWQDLKDAKDYAYRLWADWQMRKRGWRGNLNRFYNYSKSGGVKKALLKSGKYLGYLAFKRRKFMGKI